MGRKAISCGSSQSVGAPLEIDPRVLELFDFSYTLQPGEFTNEQLADRLKCTQNAMRKRICALVAAGKISVSRMVHEKRGGRTRTIAVYKLL